MGIEIANAASMPAVVYDKIHMAKLEISQPTHDNDAQSPIYAVSVSYRHYGVVNGVRYYANEDVQRVSMSDFLSEAMVAYGNGDASLILALQSIEQAVASIISSQVGVQATVV